MFEKSFYLDKEDNQIGCVMLNQLVLNLATSSGTHTENRVAFSLMPYLTPTDVFDSKTNKKGFKRIRKHVMFDIDPLPDKIGVMFDTGH